MSRLLSLQLSYILQQIVPSKDFHSYRSFTEGLEGVRSGSRSS